MGHHIQLIPVGSAVPVDEGVDDDGIEGGAAFAPELGECLLQGHWVAVVTLGRQGLEDVGHGDDPCTEGNRLTQLLSPQ